MTFEYRSAEGHPERLPPLAMEPVSSRAGRADHGIGDPDGAGGQGSNYDHPYHLYGRLRPCRCRLGRKPGPARWQCHGPQWPGRGPWIQAAAALARSPPRPHVIAVLRNPDTPYTSLALKEVTTAAEAGQTRLEVLEARTADQVPGRFETAINAGAAGLLVLEDPSTFSICRHIAELAAQFRLPTR